MPEFSCTLGKKSIAKVLLMNKTMWKKWLEITALLFSIGVALLFRLWQLDSVPPGLHFDEAIDLRWGHNIVAGARPIYITEGWGREALYYYFLATVLQIIPDNVLALRLTAVLCSLGSLLAIYFWVHRIINPLAAWMTTAWFSVIFWSVFTSRFAVRDISLLLLASLTFIIFWYAYCLPDNHTLPRALPRFTPANWQLLLFILAGFLLGLTMYTYQPARFLPIVFILFGLYLFLFHRLEFKRQWWRLGLFGAIALLVALPLIITVINNSIGEAERAWTIEPLTQLLQGNIQPVWQNGIATLKMFTISGDPLNSYNVSGRPVFQPAWTGVFFYIGLLIALWRWRQPIYAFLLICLVIMLAPTVLTISAPNFNRTLVAQTAVFIIAALPVSEGHQWLVALNHRRFALLPVILGIVALSVTAVATWRDYFHVWPQLDTVSVQYNAAIHDIVRYLQDNPDPRPRLINSRSLEDAAPYILEVSLDQPDLDIRWVDTGQALALPGSQHQVELLVTTDRWVDSDLSAFVGLPPAKINEARFAAFDLSVDRWPESSDISIRVLPISTPVSTEVLVETAVHPLPLSFQDRVQLTGIHHLDPTWQPGQTLTFFTTWQVQQQGQPIPLAIFMHLLDTQEQIVGQQDGLGFPPHSWQPGDEFVHVHHILTPADLPPGIYWLQFGLYNRDTGQRWLLWDDQQVPLGDRILLGPIRVE